MQPKVIDASLSISEQITAAEVASIAAAGYLSIICN